MIDHVSLLEAKAIFGSDIVPSLEIKLRSLSDDIERYEFVISKRIDAVKKEYPTAADFDKWFIIRKRTFKLAQRVHRKKEEFRYIKNALLIFSDSTKDWETKVAAARVIPLETLFSGKLKRSGKNLMGHCPFHEDKTPSFSISPKKNLFHCFGCGEAGDVISYLQKIKNLDFKEAVRELT